MLNEDMIKDVLEGAGSLKEALLVCTGKQKGNQPFQRSHFGSCQEQNQRGLWSLAPFEPKRTGRVGFADPPPLFLG